LEKANTEMNRKQALLPTILAYPNWRHRVYLGNGLFTPGYNTLDHDWQFYGMPENLKGKSVLDIGANDGYYSFMAEGKGATEITALDIYGGDGSTMVGGWPIQGITLLKQYLDSKVEIIADSVYNVPTLGKKWDVVLCNDVLSWLEDVPKALDAITASCNEQLIIHDTFLQSGSKITQEFRDIGIARLNRMNINYVIAELHKRGFRKVEIKRIYSYKHFEWQAINFPLASSAEPVECAASPMYPKVVKMVVVDKAWVLLKYRGYVYLRDLGWVKESEVQISHLASRLWLRLLKQLIPYSFMHWWHSRNNLEKGTSEYVITCFR
jgi:tRNA (mo5U34)-methyltransferase